MAASNNSPTNSSDDSPLVAFRRCLRESRLLDAEAARRANVVLDDPRVNSPAEAARLLVRENLVTRFQAERLIAGRTRGYFIEDYRLLDLLGVGGMGMVYLSHRLGSDLLVALKTLNAEFQTDPGLKARLEIEYTIGRLMDHPNVISTLDRGMSGGLEYIATKYFLSVSLQELLMTGGLLELGPSCDLIRQVALGLSHIHSHGVVHRDIKPENLLVSKSGMVKVMDFGLSLMPGATEAEFSLAMLFGQDRVGTADYVSPEQSRDSQHVDARSDLYSLGCTAYAVLTGRTPFPLDSARAKLEAHRTAKPRPIAKFRKNVPPEVIAIVDRLMAKDPNDRYATAREVAEALKPFSERTPLEFSVTEVLKGRRKIARQKERAAQYSFARRQSHTELQEARVSSLSDEESEPLGSDEKLEGSEEEITVGPVRRGTPQPEASNGPPLAELEPIEPVGTMPLTLRTERATIGAGPGNALRIDANNVSAQHGEFRRVGNRWTLIRLTETGELRVNGQTRRHMVIRDGDVVSVGESHRYRFVDHKSVPAGVGLLADPKMRWIVGSTVAVVLVAVMGWMIWG